ncbi:MAG: DUF362 domain-containing protein [Thermodesulfobacteriota bacterium]
MALQNFSRRIFLQVAGLVMFFLSFGEIWPSRSSATEKGGGTPNSGKDSSLPLGTSHHGASNVYLVKGLSPEENVKRAIELMGGIEEFVEPDDIVILKPNAQWWNHGTTNTNNMKGLIELILARPGFHGEIIIAENHHYKDVDSRGWNTEERNGDYNLNELVNYFNENGHENISKNHWVDGGQNPNPLEGDAAGGRVVRSVEEGDGYVWLADKIYESPEGRRCMMTYPVFTSRYSGKKIDIMRGSLVNGEYVDNVKLVNFSCLNHHGRAFGVTASIKNLMGVTDMTCGFQGREPTGMYNMHFVGKMSRLYRAGVDLKYYGRKFGLGPGVGRKVMNRGYWHSQYTGGALGYWLKNVRMPDLNILAAEYVGWGGRGRHGPYKRHQANCVACSVDPVALDYVGAKKILLEATPSSEKKYLSLNSPDRPPFKLFLEECHNQGVGNLSMERINIIETVEHV